MVSLRPVNLVMVALCIASFSNMVLCDPIMQPLIDKICRSLEDYGYCNKVFNDNLAGHSKNMQGLGEIAQSKSLDSASDTHLFVLKLLNNAEPGAEKNALKECVDAYSVVSNQFQIGVLRFGQGKYQDTLDTERITARAQSSCTSTFNVPPYPQNPLIERNRESRILIAMAITTLLELVKSS